MFYPTMARSRGTRSDGGSFTEATKLAVWQKAAAVPGYNTAVMRQDACGARIQWSMYGDMTPLGGGWEIDHIRAVANGGSDDPSNLQALQWQNNRAKGDGPLVCAVVGKML